MIEASIPSSPNLPQEEKNQSVNYQNENIPDDSEIRGTKRKLRDKGSPCCSKSLKLIKTDFIDDLRTIDLLDSPLFQNEIVLESSSQDVESLVSGVNRNSLGASEEESVGAGETSGSVIYISDDEEDNPEGKDAPCKDFITLSEWPEHNNDAAVPVFDVQKDIKLSCINQETSPDLFEHEEEDKKSPELMAGLYTIVCVHLELFRSSKSGSAKLTQLGCVVSGLDHQNSFFKAIKPWSIEKYLDNYKLGGDLLQALHMTREDDGTFLFRSRFEAINEEEKIVCVEEREALASFLDFLQSFPNCVIVGVDEETVAILTEKLKYVDGKKFKIISGFTYWKRVLKYLDVEGYKSIDLEEYYASLVGKDLPSLNSALDIASVVLESVKDVTSKEKGGKKSLDANFYKLCKRIECIEYPSRIDCDLATDVENIEVYSSFRPAVSATISAEKLEEIVLSSESDSEPEETGSCQTGLDKHVDEDMEVFGAGEMNESSNDVDIVVRNKRKRKKRRLMMKLRKASKQLSSTTDETGSPAERRKNGIKASSDPGKVPPIRIKTLLQKSGSISTVTMQEPQPTNADTWQIGQPTPKEGTIICPSPKCTITCRVKYSRLLHHLSKQHPNMEMQSLLCPVCKKSVTAAEVHVHMPRCSPGPGKKPRVPNNTAQQAAAVNSRSLRHLLPKFKTILSNADRSKAPAVSCAPIPGVSTPVEWSGAEDNTASAQALAALRIVLDSYLLTNFVPFRGGLNNCPQMYKHYQETMQSQGHREVMTSANFVSAVAGLAKAHWDIDVGPVRVESGQQYFRGFKKFTIDSFHTVL